MRAERRLAAIMAADVVGYSRLMGNDEEGTVRKIKSLIQDVVRPALDEHRGRLVKTMGDGFLAEFASVVEGFNCALRLQDAAVARAVGVAPAEQIVLRIGINVGDIIIDDGDVFGDGVNIAARLESLAKPGGINVSHRAWEDLHKLKADFDDLGEQKLKNIARPIRIYAYRPPSAEPVAEPEPEPEPPPNPDSVETPAAADPTVPASVPAPAKSRRWPLIAGAGVATVAVVVMAVFGLRPAKPPPLDPYAFVQAQISKAPCSWLRVSDHSGEDGLEIYKLSGAINAGRDAFAQALVGQAKVARVDIDRIIMSDVAPLDPDRCAWVDTLKAFRYAGVPRFELRLVRKGRGVTRAQLTFDPQALGAAGALYGIEPSGRVERIVGRRQLASLGPPALVVDKRGRHTLNIDIDRMGWNGIVFMETATPPPNGLVEKTLQVEADRKRFGDLARAGAWRFEMAWFEVQP